jgi:hypothetical protein
MENGGTEVIDTMFCTRQDQLTLDFSKHYAVIPTTIYAHTNPTGIINISELQRIQVRVKAGDGCIARLHNACR